jgi:hypothetical protein
MIAAAVLLMQVATATSSAPFGVGEVLEYSARYKFLRPGSARLEVASVESVRGVPSWHFKFTSKISYRPFFRNETQLESWTGVRDFISRRFLKVVKDGGDTEREDFRIHPDSGFFRRGADTGTKAISDNPLDDVAFFYFIRTQPLVVGQTYRFDRYWRKDRNPVTIRVLRRELIEMPGGVRTNALVLHPIVNEQNGMFEADKDARIWLTDDWRRYPARIESNYDFGKVSLVLTRVTPNR